MKVALASVTPKCEEFIARCVRISSDNRDNPEYAKLFAYLVSHKHWSPFEMGHMVIEIETSRAIAAQILRHRSFSFQELSQRYANSAHGCEIYEGRRQAEKNRQSSIDDLDGATKNWFSSIQKAINDYTFELYDTAISSGVAREQARMLLPLATRTTLLMAGSVRSWIHYCELRCAPDTQKEHRDIAVACRNILVSELPTLAVALGWPVTP